MAKKKRKPVNNRKSPQTHSSQMNRGEALAIKAKQSFKEQIRSAKENPNIDNTIYEGLDFDPVRQKRRIQAILSTLDQVKSVVRDPEGVNPELFTVESEWININTYPLAGYDLEERYTCSAFAAAIWMLDQLDGAGKMHCLDSSIGIEPDGDLPPTPSVWDLCHGTDVIQSMMKAIYLRNGEQKLYALSRNDEIIRVYMAENVAKGTIDRSAETCVPYEEILAQIPETAIEKAVAHYEQVYWDWVDRYFRSRIILAKTETDYYQELLQLEADVKSTLLKKNPMPDPGAVLKIQNLCQENTLCFPSMISGTIGSVGSLPALDEARGLDFRRKNIERDQEEIEQKTEDFWHLVGFIPQWTYEQTSHVFSHEIADIWRDFETGDPYEMAFAFMYLLDKGSDLPWCYFPGTNVHTSCAGKLPWTRIRFNPLNDGIFYHFDSDTGDIKYGPPEVQLPKRIKVPDLEDWYSLSYVNREEESPELFNLAQIMYEVTGCIMPRKLDRYVPALKTLDKYGITGKRSLHSLLYCMTLLGESKHQTIGHCSEIEIEDDEEEAPEQTQTESIENLQKQIAFLKEELKKQKQQVHESSRDARDMRIRYESLAQLAANDAQELHDLRELIFHQQEGSYENAASDQIDFPYTSENRIVVFGGHESWAREIKPKLPDVRFVDREVVPNPNLIRNSDVIWIQTNALCHPHFYKIVDEAKKYNIPIRYFSYASPIKCAEQLVLEDRKMR